MTRLISIWNNILTLALPFLLIGVMLGYVHLPILFAFFILLLLSMKKMELCISMLLIFPPLLGTIFQIFDYSIPGSIIPVFFVLLLLPKRLSKILYNKRGTILFTLVIISIFVVYYFLTAKTEYSEKKIVELLITSFIYFIAFSLMSSSSNIDTSCIGKIFYVYGLVLTSIGLDILSYSQFNNLFDFSSFRDASNAMKELELISISYHSVGIAGMTGLAFLMSSPRNRKVDFFIVPAFIWLILISGARQALVGALLVFFMKYVMNHRKLNMVDVAKWAILLVIIIIALLIADIETVNSVFDSKASAGERLNRNFDYPFKILEQHFIDGIGFGNYDNTVAREVYPHNIILEILCEMGFVGFLILSFVVFIFIIRNKISLRYQLLCRSYAIIIYTPYLVRSLISDSIGHNISVFILLFTLYSKEKDKFLTSSLNKERKTK